MLAGLKDKAIAKTLAVLEDKMGNDLNDKMEVFKSLKPADVADDAKYLSVVVQPLWLYVQLQSGGAISAVEKVMDADIATKFSKGLFHVRDELISVDGDKVILAPAFSDKLAPTLIQALKS